MLLGSAAVVLLQALTGLDAIRALALLVLLLVVSPVIGRVLRVLSLDVSQKPPVRVAVIGNPVATELLRREVERSAGRYEFLGRIAPPGDNDGSVALMALETLRSAVVEHDIRLLILSPTASRELVLDELVGDCLDLPVQLVELTAFCRPSSVMSRSRR